MELKLHTNLIIQFRRYILIVPDGIETWKIQQWKLLYLNFNRTRWNWNLVEKYTGETEDFILIVPDGIETIVSTSGRGGSMNFNRTRWNWNWTKQDVTSGGTAF